MIVNPFAPPADVQNSQPFSNARAIPWKTLAIAIVAAIVGGVLFAWVDATQQWSEPFRLLLPMTVYGIAAMVIALIGSSAASRNVLILMLIPIANTAGFWLTGTIWDAGQDLAQSRSIDPANPASFTIVLAILVGSTMVGLVPTAAVLWIGRAISLSGAIWFVLIGGLLGLVAVIITNVDFPMTTRFMRAFATMAMWQLVLLTMQARLQSNHVR